MPLLRAQSPLFLIPQIIDENFCIAILCLT
jgi:hypothetical protein